MLLPPQNLKATYTAGTITITWNTAPNSDTPTAVEITLANKTTIVPVPAPPAAISYVVPAATVSKFAGTTVSVTVAYSILLSNQHTNAITSVAVPGTAPPPPPTIGPPTNLSVVYDPSTHSVQFHWVNHGHNSGNYDKVLVQWGIVTDPHPAQLPDLPGTTTQAGPLGAIYPNTDYVFKVEGGTSAGLGGYTYTGWTILNWRSPDGPPPFVGWFRNWFQIHPETPLQPSQPASGPSHPPRYVSALWGTGSRNNHLDLFLAGGIPTLGVTWTDSWEPQPGWVPWTNVSNAVWAPMTFTVPGGDVTAVWRPNDTHLDLFAVANNGTVWSNWWEPKAGWQSWFPIDDQIKMAPGASVTAVWRPNATHLDLYVCGTAGVAGMAWTTWWEPNKGWHPWTGVSNAVWAPNVFLKPGAKITALWRDNNHLDVFGTANDGSVWSNWWESGPGWQNWFAVPNPTAIAAPGSPVTALWTLPSTLLELYATGADGRVITTHWTSSGWTNWVSLNPSTKLTPGAAVTVVPNYQLTQLEVFGVDTNGNVSTTARALIYPTLPWQGWTAIRTGPKLAPGGTVAAVWRPVGSNANPTHLDLFVRGADASVWSIWWEAGYFS